MSALDKFPNINKVEGSVPLNKTEERLNENRKLGLEDYADCEILPTTEENQVIDMVVLGLKVMFEYVYKIECKDIQKEKIHIVKGNTLGEYGRGIHRAPVGDIYVESAESCGSKIVFAKVLSHELIHYLSYNSVKSSTKDGEVDVSPHIGGLSILKYDKTGIRDYFHEVDEALTMYISSKFMRLELNRIRNKEEVEKGIYGDECLANDVIRDWLHGLPDSFGINKTEWDAYYIVSIPFAEQIAKVIKSYVSVEEKVNFYREKIGYISIEDRREFYLERTDEMSDVYTEISAMLAPEESDPETLKKKSLEFIDKLVMLKLTGKGFWDVVRFVEKRLGPGSFKEFAVNFGRFERYYEVSPEIKKWIDENYPKLNADTSELSYEEWGLLDDEVKKRIAESDEFALEWMRRKYPNGSEEITALEDKLISLKKEKARNELERQQEEVESKIPKNLLTNFEDTQRAIGLIEGEGWLMEEQRYKENPGTSYSTYTAIKGLKDNLLANREIPDGIPLFTVYGSGGYNRYFVYQDGSVKFSGGHSTPTGIEKAKRLGFVVLD